MLCTFARLSCEEEIPGIATGGTFALIGRHLLGAAQLNPGERYRLRMLVPPRVNQSIIIDGQEHVALFGMVNGQLVVLDAVVDHALVSSTDLVLGSSALRQIYDARRKIPGTDDIGVFEDKALYKKIQYYPWYVSRSFAMVGSYTPPLEFTSNKKMPSRPPCTSCYEVSTRAVKHLNCAYPTRAMKKTSRTRTQRQPYVWWLTGAWWLWW